MADPFHIVLFGSPSAGKSSLLGALAQAGDAQTDALGGKLHDNSGGLAELKNETYQKGPGPEKEDLRSFPVALEAPARGHDGTISADISDCSAAAAQAILGSKSLPQNLPLAKALLGADALILLLDVSAIEREVPLLGAFLRLFQEARSGRTDIAGLPVYLVLSKCDLIAKSDENFNQWVVRVEEAKRKLGERFQAMVQEQATLPFGRVKLHLWASAIKRPAFADRPARPEPFGVAELFRQVFRSAEVYRAHQDHAAGRLSLAVAGMFSLVAVLGALAGSLYLARPSAALAAIENRIQAALPGSSPADRLREPLDERLQELTQIRDNPYFERLPAEQRTLVEKTRREIEQYQTLYKQFITQVPDPRFATRDEELDRLEKALEAFALPAEYAESWKETKLIRRLQQWRFDIGKLRETEDSEEAWLRQQAEESQKLIKQGGLAVAKALSPEERAAWFQQVQDYLDREPRHKRTDRIAPGASLSYDNVYKMQRVEQARKAWDRAKDSLRDLRKLAQ